MRKLSPVLAVAAGLAFASGPAAAHVGHAHPLSSAIWDWTFEPWVTISMGVASILYLRGVLNMRARSERLIRLRELAAFLAGLVALLIALESPIDALSADLFSVHMVQHLILMLVAAPLFVLARPHLVFLWGFPPGGRRRLGRFWAAGAGRVIQALSSPVSVWLWFCGLFAFWHLPGPYQWALRHEGVHIFEHICFFVSAFAFWSVVMERDTGRLGYGGRLIFVATAAVLSGLPGALMVLTDRPFYGIHAESAALWGLTALQDQQLAGLIMWVPAGFAYVAAIMILFVRWMAAAEKRAEARAARAARFAGLASTAIACLMVLSGCDDQSVAREAHRIPGGDPDRGARQIVAAGCGTCHMIPGVDGAEGLVGPPLDHMDRRVLLAGRLSNTPDNMILWLRRPQLVEPGTGMPDTGLSDQQARDVAAYLYTLK